MRKMDVQDMSASVIVDDVTKIYTQWQRGGKLRDLARNLIHPEKKEVKALDHLSLRVRPGEFVAYAGANGAGKSTTIKILSGLLQPTSGRVRVLGLDPAAQRIPVMRRIGVLFGQRTELWWDHPVQTSFEWKKQVWNIPDEVYRKNLARVTELLDLGPLLHTFGRELSLGQRMRADLAMLLLHGPELLFLDEPTLGLDVLAKRQMISFLKQLNREEGTTIVVTSHDMDDLEEMARRIILLSQGQLVFDGSFDALREKRGGLSRIQITCPGTPPELSGLRLLSSREETHVYEAAEQLDTGKLLKALSELPGVRDLEIRHAPIEDIIAGLYLELREKH